MPTHPFTIPAKNAKEFSDGRTQSSYPIIVRPVQTFPEKTVGTIYPTHRGVNNCSKSKMKEIAGRETKKWARKIFDELDSEHEPLKFGYKRTQCYTHSGNTPGLGRFSEMYTNGGLKVFIEYKKFHPA